VFIRDLDANDDACANNFEGAGVAVGVVVPDEHPIAASMPIIAKTANIMYIDLFTETSV